MALKLMKISEGLDILELPMGNPESLMNLVVVRDSQDIVLIDTGLPGQLDALKREMENAGIAFDCLTKVIITHHDGDHIGNLAAIQKALPRIKVFSHVVEKPYIEYAKKPLKMPQQVFDDIKSKRSPEDFAKVDVTMEDGDILPYCGDIEVIHTPGHTHGHICLYLRKYKTVIVGDAMNISDSKLAGPDPIYTYDMELGLKSLRKLLKFDINTVITYHCGVYNGNPVKRIEELAG